MLDENKIRFMEQKNATTAISKWYIKNQFDKIVIYENNCNKMCQNFSLYDILNYYKYLDWQGLESLMVLNSLLSEYQAWCYNEKIVDNKVNNYELIDKQMLANCINKRKLDSTVIKREDLLNYCYQLTNSKDRVILLGLFEGLGSKDYKDLWNLKNDDVDFKTNTLNLENRKIVVSDELIGFIQGSMEETVYNAVSGQGLKQMALLDTGYVIKSYPNQNREDTSEFQKGRVIYGSIKRCLNSLGLGHLKGNDIVNSGKIHFIREEAAKLRISPDDYIKEKSTRDILNYRFNTIIVYSNFRIKYKDYLI